MLPYDILTRIIDQLASQGNYEDLRSCSQTCQMLVHPCRVHLFSTVIVTDNAYRFADLLKRNPTIANYIQNLTYHYRRVLSEDVALLLSNVKTLVLRAQGACEWALLSPHSQHALIHLFSSPSLTCLHIDRFEGLPAILLSICSNLKQLKISSCHSFSPEACSTVAGAPPKLLSFHVTNHKNYNAIEELCTIRRPDSLPILNLSGLRSLVVDIKTIKDEIVLGDTLRLIDNLRTLKLLQHTISDNLAHQLTVSLPTVRSLHLQWISPIEFDCLPLAKLLGALACQPNCLNELRISICIDCHVHCVAQALDILGDRPGFRQLEKLRIKMWCCLHQSWNFSQCI